MTTIKKYDEVSSLWLEYKSGLEYYVLKRLKNEDLAKEIAHEVLMKIYNSCCSGKEIINVRSWMFQIAHNSVMDYFKRENKYTDEVSDMLEEEDETNAYKEAESLIGPLVSLLPEKYSVALRLSDIEGMKQAEVAKTINLSLTATKSRIQRARILLKKKIVDCSIMETNANGSLTSMEIKSSCEPFKRASK